MGRRRSIDGAVPPAVCPGPSTPLTRRNAGGFAASMTVSALKPVSCSTSSQRLGFGCSAMPKVARCTTLRCALSNEFSSARSGLVSQRSWNWKIVRNPGSSNSGTSGIGAIGSSSATQA